MDQLDQIVSMLALTMGVAWASGINLYAALFMLGFMGATGNMTLPPELAVLQNPLVMFAAGAMYVAEFVADKIPGVDTGWDAVHTFIRIPAGAMLAAGAVGHVDPAVAVAAGILGGSLTAVTHATKAGARVLVNASPEPFSNWAISLGEDVAVIGGLWTALHHPLLFLMVMVLLMIAMVWALPKLWRGIRLLFRKTAELFGIRRETAVAEGQPPVGDEAGSHDASSR